MTHPASRIIALVALSMLAACFWRSPQIPRADHMHGPLPHQSRRQPNYRSETFWSRLQGEAYEPVTQLPQPISRDQELTIREFGNPDYARRFESLEDEEVLEWLNVDHNTLFQYVNGELVFQGAARDLEHTLLRYGQPNEVMYHVIEPRIERITFVYSPTYSPERQYFDFADGMLVYEEHHN